MSIRRAFLLLVIVGSTIVGIADDRYFTPWYAVCWGLIAGTAALTMTEDSDGWNPHLRLAAPVQVVLVLALIAGALAATRWSALGQRDAIQWGWTMWTIPSYWDGVKWGYRKITHPGPAS